MGFSLQSGAMKGGLLKGADTLDISYPALIGKRRADYLRKPESGEQGEELSPR